MSDSPNRGAPIVGQLPPGEDLLRAIEATCAAHGAQSGRVEVAGPLRRAVVRPAPGAALVTLEGALELVSAHAVVGAGPLVLRGVVSWSDHGLPRLAAGVLTEAVSDGLVLALEVWRAGAVSGRSASASAGASPSAAASNAGAAGRASTAGSASARGRTPALAAAPGQSRSPSPPSAAPDRPSLAQAARSAPRPAAAGRSRFEDDEDEDDEEAELHEAHVDLTPELGELVAKPIPPSTGSGWAGVVAASQQATRAVRANPTADDLGFETEGAPDLQRGDILFHQRLGRCVVLRGAGGADKIKVQRAAGAQVDLSLKALAFRRRPDDGHHRVYEVRAL